MARKKLVDEVEGKVPDGTYLLVKDPTDILQLVSSVQSQEGLYALDTETDSLDTLSAKMHGWSIAPQEGLSFYIKWEDMTKECIESFKSLVETKPGVYANFKYDFQILRMLGITPLACDDTLVMQYVLDQDNNSRGIGMGLKPSVLRHLGFKMTTFEEMTQGQPIEFVDEQVLTDYAAADADMTLRLRNHLAKMMADQPSIAFAYQLDMAILPVIGKMELRGIHMEKGFLESASDVLAPAIERIRQEIQTEVGVPFELDSPKQLGIALFETLGLPAAGTTKGGQFKTDAATLGKLSEDYSIVKKVLEYRATNKLTNTFVKGLIKGCSAVDNACHASFLSTIVPTGRFACATGAIGGGGYNLQQIPKSKVDLADGTCGAGKTLMAENIWRDIPIATARYVVQKLERKYLFTGRNRNMIHRLYLEAC